MKYILTAFLSVVLTTLSFAQVAQQDNDAPYLKDKKAPTFTITTIQGKEATHRILPTKYKFTCYIIFSPDCSHCEHEAEELTNNADKFKNVFFIWDSYREMDAIKKFASKYGLDRQANVLIGRDPTYSLASFFRPKMTPFVAIYKNGGLLKVYEQGVKVSELIKIIEGN